MEYLGLPEAAGPECLHPGPEIQQPRSHHPDAAAHWLSVARQRRGDWSVGGACSCCYANSLAGSDGVLLLPPTQSGNPIIGHVAWGRCGVIWPAFLLFTSLSSTFFIGFECCEQRVHANNQVVLVNRWVKSPVMLIFFPESESPVCL